MNGLIIVKPVAVTPENLRSNVPENDHPTWTAAETYADGMRVVWQHRVYESLQAASLGKQPDTEALWWVEVGPTNLWRAFDLSLSTRTAQAHSMWFEVSAGVPVTAIALRNLVNAQQLRVTVIDPDFGLLYQGEEELVSAPNAADWWQWTFGPRHEMDHTHLLDLPSYPNAVVRIELTGGPALAVGVVLFGQQQEMGLGVESGVRMGIRDYSRKERNEWGDTVLQQRGFAATRSISMPIRNEELDNVERTLSALRATPVLWLVSEKLRSLNVWGWYSNFDVLVSYNTYSDVSIEIEGLTDDSART